MNEIFHRKYVLELDIWSANAKEAEEEVAELGRMLKFKKLLNHCGNVKLSPADETRYVAR